MNVNTFLRLTKGEIVQQGNDQARQTEIILKADPTTRDSKIGPTVGLVSREGIWFNGKKKDCDAKAWESITSLRAGDRVALKYVPRAWTSKDGRSGVSNDITWFDRVIRAEDEVVRPPDGPDDESPQGDAPPAQQEWSPKQTCINAATSLVVALIGAGAEIPNPVEEIGIKARAFYLELKETW